MKKIFMDKSFISLIIFFITGLIIGIVFTFLLKEDDKTMISKSILEYINLLKTSNITYSNFINSFLPSFLFINIIFISSFLFIFFPLIYFLNFYKGFISGFTIGALIISYRLKGVLYALIFAFPHELLLILFILFISTLMIKNTIKLINIFKEDKSIKIRLFYKRFLVLYFGSILILILITLLELFINTYLVKVLF